MPYEGELECVEHSGGLFTDEIIYSLRDEGSSFTEVSPGSFSLDGFEPQTDTDLEKAIGRAWETLKEKWDRFYRAYRNDANISVSDARKIWILPLFRQLGFHPEWIVSSLERGGKSFNLSHRGWKKDTAPIIHSVKPSQCLDDRPEDAARGARSPHDLVQEFLNLDQEQQWATFTNGLRLRLIRDFYHEITKGYLEFDLENIFESRRYDDFRALFRLIHASRFLQDDSQEVRLESIHKRSRQAGVAAGKDLRKNVRDAIESLANGLLENEPLDSYKESDENCEDFYEEVLTLIYRILFLLFAEQRGMVPSKDLMRESFSGSKELTDLYTKEYSVTSLRDRAERGSGSPNQTDLWEGLKVTFRIFKEGNPPLGIFPYNGELFDPDSTSLVNKLSCSNKHLLDTISSLTLVDRGGVLQHINYETIGVEEIGAIYENLLDFQPRVPSEDEEVEGEILEANRFVLDPRGSKRKGTGSFYTRPSLVNQLIETSLKPVIDKRLEEKETEENKEDALLDIKVCDPACGSAAFLIKANNVLAQRLAQVRTDSDYPSDSEIIEARRDVLRHSIYGVDLNPMAVELAKVSLWINATVQDKPLNFLNHRIKVGNSLIGTVPGNIEQGITQETFSLQYMPEGDDREIVKELRKRARSESKGGMKALDLRSTEEVDEVGSEYMEELGDIPEESAEDITFKQDFYEDYVEDEKYRKQKFIHDLWTAAFFWRNTNQWDWYPAPANFDNALNNPSSVPKKEREEVNRLAEENKFFHWHLAFPEVFNGENPGFDCVLGNPPWGRIKLQEKKFFAGRNEDIVEADNKSRRRKKIDELENEDPELFQMFNRAKRKSDCQSKFLRESGRYPFTGKGDINTYAVFAEADRDLISEKGSVGVVIPSGLATDKTTAAFFRDLMDKNQISSMYDFENREGLFHEIHKSYKFSLLTLRGESSDIKTTDFAYFMTNLDQLSEDDRHFTLSAAEIKLLNPNTRTCPVFRSKTDAELTKKLYRQAPVLINEETGENPWGIRFKTMFHMSNDSHLFNTRDELEEMGYELDGNHFVKGNERYLPLYEAKMFHLFDHRFAEFTGTRTQDTVKLEIPDKKNTDRLSMPRYWINSNDVCTDNNEWFICFRNVARNTDVRTAIFSYVPYSGVGNSAPIIQLKNTNPENGTIFLANVCSFAFDFIVRQKIGGMNLNFYLVKQLPVFPTSYYTPKQHSFIVPRMLELSYTANDMKGFAKAIIEEVGTRKWNEWFPNNKVKDNKIPNPFVWNEERRFQLRSELDAMYAHLYNVTKAELDYILETFPIVKRQDIEEHGTYMTKNRILKEYEKLS